MCAFYVCCLGDEVTFKDDTKQDRDKSKKKGFMYTNKQ